MLRSLWFDFVVAWLRGSLLALNAVLISYFLATQLGWPLPWCVWLVAAWGAWTVNREWKRSLRRRRERAWHKNDPGESPDRPE